VNIGECCMVDLEIKGFLETSFLDWDGKIVSTLFVPSCNFRCPFCHNMNLIDNPQQYDTIPFSRIEKYLVEHKDFIDGVCLTGGEPALHKDRGLYELMERIKKIGLLVKLDTNGTGPEVIEEALARKLVDFIAMDIKGPLDERYHKLSGVKADLEKIKRSIKLIMESGVPYEFRTTVIPSFMDTADVEAIAASIPGASKFVLQQFVPDNAHEEALREIRPFSSEKLQEMARAAKKFVRNTSLRGDLGVGQGRA